MAIKFFIDAGHGGSDPGATANGLREKDLTLAIAKKIQAKLKDYENISVKLSRTSDQTLTLNQRVAMANSWNADYFLSIHINAGGGTGYEDFIYNKLSNSSNTAKTREIMHKEIVKQLGNVRNRGKKKANFLVLRESKMPAMLSENMFIDTKSDVALLKTNSFLDKVAQGHVNGLVKAFKLKKKPASKPEVKPVPKPKNDVDGHWAEKELKKAKEKKIIMGYTDGTMKPNEPVSRAQLAVILDRLGLLK